MSGCILIVEDENSVSEGIGYALQQEGFETVPATDGHLALTRFEQHHPDLVILDLMLPGINGWDLFSAYRRQRPEVPIILVTARAEEFDRVAGLEMGADDYITKPFSMRELVARVRTVLRRCAGQRSPDAAIIQAAGIRLDGDRHEVLVDDQPVTLSPKEFDLLAYLMRHAGRVRTREEILQDVWGQDSYLDERTVDVHVRWLRRKIEEDSANPRRLLTVRGLGYKFADGP